MFNILCNHFFTGANCSSMNYDDRYSYQTVVARFLYTSCYQCGVQITGCHSLGSRAGYKPDNSSNYVWLPVSAGRHSGT